MRVLVACEFSGVVRDAFRRRGHDAFSCDLPGIEPEGDFAQYHFAADVLEIIPLGWDMMIGFPPCNYICSSGLHWNKRIAGRADKTEKALDFVSLLWSAPIKKIALENPNGCISTRLLESRDMFTGSYISEGKRRGVVRPTQIIQPYDFDEDASKATCLFLKNLPKLKPTRRFPGRMVEWPRGSGKMVERWSNQTDSGQNRLSPSDTRAADRARTYPGIGNAFAEQWG